jgi:hydroxymethylpyrimidine/phosphomethylpyrimidine kinase
MKSILTIAGSDSSGGAGIQADLKTFEAFGLFGTSAITVLTAQNTGGVTAIEEVSPEFITAQIDAIISDIDISAIKIGMLYSSEIIVAVREIIKDLNIPIVIDPVFVSKAGSQLLQDSAIEDMKTLFPYATIITPNLFEAKKLFDYKFGNSASFNRLRYLEYPVLIKNHKLSKRNGDFSIDILFENGQKAIFETESVETNNLHGTGCSYSSAIASNLALGYNLHEAIGRSKEFIFEALLKAPKVGRGGGPINHKEGGKIFA